MKKVFLSVLIIISLLLMTASAITTPQYPQFITVAGTIRNTGAGWQVISGDGHYPVNITNVTTTSTKILLDHDVGATYISTFIATPDETMTRDGYTVGVSGGISGSYIYIYDKNHVLVNPATYTNAGGNIWIYALLVP